jgi:hypothetical protein
MVSPFILALLVVLRKDTLKRLFRLGLVVRETLTLVLLVVGVGLPNPAISGRARAWV